MLCKFLFACAIIFYGASALFAQQADSLNIRIGAIGTYASQAYQPLWLVSNLEGAVKNRKSDMALQLSLEQAHSFTLSGWRRNNAVAAQQAKAYLRYGFDLHSNDHFKALFFREAYVKIGMAGLEARVGRYREVQGMVNELSSGSFAISGNALPIPKAGLAVPDFKNVPFTKGFVQFKGHFMHGWLERSAYVNKAYLHEKGLYVKLGRSHLNFHAGVNHFAQWGGEHPKGRAPSRFKDFLRIVLGAGGDGDDPVYQQGPVDVVNAVGNHLIVSDLGISYRKQASVFKLYTQTIFDKGVGTPQTRDKLNYLGVFSLDRLLGLHWQAKHHKLLQAVTLEGIYTMQQGGPVVYEGRFNYYNNATYLGGWQYHNQILGTPLFINKESAQHYTFNNQAKISRSSFSIVSNRLKGLHLGITGLLLKGITYRVLSTYLEHHGNYYNDVAFGSGKKQLHMLGELAFRLQKTVEVTAAVGVDKGELSNNTGGRISIAWLVGKKYKANLLN